MEGGPFSKWGSRLGAAHIRLKPLQHLHGCSFFADGVLSLAPRTFVVKACNGYTDGGRFLFKMGLSPWRRGHSSEQFATVTRMEGGSLSKWGSRLGAADIRLKSLQHSQGLRADRFRYMGFSPWRRAHSCISGDIVVQRI